MSKKFWIVLVIILAAIFVVFFNKKENTGLVNPNAVSVPTSIPNPTPKTFKFDSTTDLEKELESVNPQVLDSDFGE